MHWFDGQRFVAEAVGNLASAAPLSRPEAQVGERRSEGRYMTRWAGLGRAVLALLFAVLVCACARRVPFALSAADASRFGNVLRVAVPGHDPMIFGLNSCTLYKAKTAHDEIVGWTVVLASDWGQSSYPKWATACTAQHVRYDGKYVIADFCAQAFGAGGGCAGGDGTYRSRTGDAQGWQIRSGKGWVTLPK